MEDKNLKKRNSSIELLRLLSMLMIVFYHASKHINIYRGGYTNMVLSLNTIFILLLGSWGALGTCVFIIITAWYTCDKTGIHTKKIVYLALQSFFVSFCFFIISKYLPSDSFRKNYAIYELLTPLINENYWFITAYICFYLLIPVLQLVVRSLPNRVFSCFIIIFTVLMILNKFNHVIIFGQIGDFVYLFFVTSWLKKHENNFIERYAVLGGVLAFIIMFSSILALSYFGTCYNKLAIYNLINSLYGKWIPIYYMAFCIFYIFKNTLKINYSRIINGMAQTSLGIYILHENIILRGNTNTNSLLWNYILDLDGKYSSQTFPFYYFCGILSVFFICMIIEKIRILLIDRLILDRIKIWNPLFNKIDCNYCFDEHYEEKD